MKHKNTQPLYIFNRENPQNSEPQNGPRSGLDYIALGLRNLQEKLEKKNVAAFGMANTQFSETRAPTAKSLLLGILSCINKLYIAYYRHNYTSNPMGA